MKELGPDKFEIVDARRLSILAEPPVTFVDKVVDKHGTREVAEAYLEYLYSPEGPGDRRQALLPPARCEGRGRSTSAVLRRCSFSRSTRCSAAGARRTEIHFDDGGVFDQIYGR